MIHVSSLTAGLVLCAVVTSAALPAAAPAPAHRDAADGFVSAERARALRECSAKTGGLREYTWGVYASYQYRECMNQHGQIW